MTLTLATVACHIFPASGSWWPLKVTSALPEVACVPDRVYVFGSLLASLIYPILALFILLVVDFCEWVGGGTGAGGARGWIGIARH